MPDVRIALTDNEKKKWNHVKADIGKTNNGALMFLINFYNLHKRRQVISP